MFVVTKVAEMLGAPLNLVLGAVIAVAILLRLGRMRAARRLIEALAVTLTLVALLPWQNVLLQPLEDRIPRPAVLPAQVDGILVLGGAIEPAISAAHGVAALGEAAERITSAVELARRYPAARLVYSGGSGSVATQDLKEAPVARSLLVDLGIDPARVTFEDQSRNTRENALFSRSLAQPQPGQTWLLITSAAHMPRSLGTFRAIGWPVIPYPVDYRTDTATPFGGDMARKFEAITQALHEWAGLVYYRLRGWTDSWYPAL